MAFKKSNLKPNLMVNVTIMICRIVYYNRGVKTVVQSQGWLHICVCAHVYMCVCMCTCTCVCTPLRAINSQWHEVV